MGILVQRKVVNVLLLYRRRQRRGYLNSLSLWSGSIVNVHHGSLMNPKLLTLNFHYFHKFVFSSSAKIRPYKENARD